MVKQVSITLDDSVLDSVDSRALSEGISRSKYLSNVISTFIHGGDTVSHLELLIKEKDKMIDELRRDKTFLEGTVSQLMTERDRLLPAPGGFWSRLFGRKT